MADTVDTNVLFNGTHRYVANFTNEGDGTGESAVTKVDISTLVGPSGSAPSKTVVEGIVANVQGFDYVTLEWAHTTNDEIAVCGAGTTFKDYTPFGGKVDPGSAGGTGDIVFTTNGGVAGSSYDITLYLRLKD